MKWEEKTVRQAVEDGEGTVTLHFEHKRFFDIEGEKHETDAYGDFEFQLDSFFTMDTLGMTTENTVRETIAKAYDYLLKHQAEW